MTVKRANSPMYIIYCPKRWIADNSTVFYNYIRRCIVQWIKYQRRHGKKMEFKTKVIILPTFGRRRILYGSVLQKAKRLSLPWWRELENMVFLCETTDESWRTPKIHLRLQLSSSFLLVYSGVWTAMCLHFECGKEVACGEWMGLLRLA